MSMKVFWLLNIKYTAKGLEVGGTQQISEHINNPT